MNNLTEQTFDLLVVGGGIFGACAAYDAAQRGLSVALIDRGDFCSATSAHSFKLLHGGLRYLQHLDVRRVRQSARARSTFIRVAPHLAHALSICVPTYGRGMKGKLALRAAMKVYDVLTADCNRGIIDPGRRIPSGACLARREVLQRYPGLSRAGLTGAGVFCDGQMYNPPRLVLAFIKSAVRCGAVAKNYVEARQFLVEDGRVRGALVRDALTGRSLTVRGRTVLNAAGPYAEPLLETGLGRALEPKTPWSRDAYLVVNRRIIEGDAALALPAATSDPEAVLSRGSRHLFLVPWQHCTLVGVWHKQYDGPPDAFRVSDDEIEAWLREINGVYRGLDLCRADVSLRVSGLIPFGENDPETEHLKFAHRSRIVDHMTEDDVEGLITMIGARYTTGPSDAVTAVNLVLRKLGVSAEPSCSHELPLAGGDIDDFEALTRRALADFPDGTDPQAVRRAVHNHGTEYTALVELIERDRALAELIGSPGVFKAEVVQAVRAEMAVTLGDVLKRRTDLATSAHPGREALESCADIMADELGWSYARRCEEVDEFEKALQPNLVGDCQPPDTEHRLHPAAASGEEVA